MTSALNRARFPTLGEMPAESVRPHTYRIEAENLARQAAEAMPHDRTEGFRLNSLAYQFHAIAEKHSWHPSALRSSALREEAHAVRRPVAGRPARGARLCEHCNNQAESGYFECETCRRKRREAGR